MGSNLVAWIQNAIHLIGLACNDLQVSAGGRSGSEALALQTVYIGPWLS